MAQNGTAKNPAASNGATAKTETPVTTIPRRYPRPTSATGQVVENKDGKTAPTAPVVPSHPVRPNSPAAVQPTTDKGTTPAATGTGTGRQRYTRPERPAQPAPSKVVVTVENDDNEGDALEGTNIDDRIEKQFFLVRIFFGIAWLLAKAYDGYIKLVSWVFYDWEFGDTENVRPVRVHTFMVTVMLIFALLGVGGTLVVQAVGNWLWPDAVVTVEATPDAPMALESTIGIVDASRATGFRVGFTEFPWNYTGGQFFMLSLDPALYTQEGDTQQQAEQRWSSVFTRFASAQTNREIVRVWIGSNGMIIAYEFLPAQPTPTAEATAQATSAATPTATGN